MSSKGIIPNLRPDPKKSPLNKKQIVQLKCEAQERRQSEAFNSFTSQKVVLPYQHQLNSAESFGNSKALDKSTFCLVVEDVHCHSFSETTPTPPSDILLNSTSRKNQSLDSFVMFKSSVLEKKQNDQDYYPCLGLENHIPNNVRPLPNAINVPLCANNSVALATTPHSLINPKSVVVNPADTLSNVVDENTASSINNVGSSTTHNTNSTLMVHDHQHKNNSNKTSELSTSDDHTDPRMKNLLSWPSKSSKVTLMNPVVEKKLKDYILAKNTSGSDVTHHGQQNDDDDNSQSLSSIIPHLNSSSSSTTTTTTASQIVAASDPPPTDSDPLSSNNRADHIGIDKNHNQIYDKNDKLNLNMEEFVDVNTPINDNELEIAFNFFGVDAPQHLPSSVGARRPPPPPSSQPSIKQDEVAAATVVDDNNTSNSTSMVNYKWNDSTNSLNTYDARSDLLNDCFSMVMGKTAPPSCQNVVVDLMQTNTITSNNNNRNKGVTATHNKSNRASRGSSSSSTKNRRSGSAKNNKKKSQNSRQTRNSSSRAATVATGTTATTTTTTKAINHTNTITENKSNYVGSTPSSSSSSCIQPQNYITINTINNDMQQQQQQQQQRDDRNCNNQFIMYNQMGGQQQQQQQPQFVDNDMIQRLLTSQGISPEQLQNLNTYINNNNIQPTSVNHNNHMDNEGVINRIAHIFRNDVQGQSICLNNGVSVPLSAENYQLYSYLKQLVFVIINKHHGGSLRVAEIRRLVEVIESQLSVTNIIDDDKMAIYHHILCLLSTYCDTCVGSSGGGGGDGQVMNPNNVVVVNRANNTTADVVNVTSANSVSNYNGVRSTYPYVVDVNTLASSSAAAATINNGSANNGVITPSEGLMYSAAAAAAAESHRGAMPPSQQQFYPNSMPSSYLSSNSTTQNIPTNNNSVAYLSSNSSRNIPNTNNGVSYLSSNSTQNIPTNANVSYLSSNSSQNIPTNANVSYLSSNSSQNIPNNNNNNNNSMSYLSSNSSQNIPTNNNSVSYLSSNSSQNIPTNNNSVSYLSSNSYQNIPSNNNGNGNSYQNNSNQNFLPPPPPPPTSATTTITVEQAQSMFNSGSLTQPQLLRLNQSTLNNAVVAANNGRQNNVNSTNMLNHHSSNNISDAYNNAQQIAQLSRQQQQQQLLYNNSSSNNSGGVIFQNKQPQLTRRLIKLPNNAVVAASVANTTSITNGGNTLTFNSPSVPSSVSTTMDINEFSSHNPPPPPHIFSSTNSNNNGDMRQQSHIEMYYNPPNNRTIATTMGVDEGYQNYSTNAQQPPSIINHHQQYQLNTMTTADMMDSNNNTRAINNNNNSRKATKIYGIPNNTLSNNQANMLLKQQQQSAATGVGSINSSQAHYSTPKNTIIIPNNDAFIVNQSSAVMDNTAAATTNSNTNSSTNTSEMNNYQQYTYDVKNEVEKEYRNRMNRRCFEAANSSSANATTNANVANVNNNYLLPQNIHHQMQVNNYSARMNNISSANTNAGVVAVSTADTNNTRNFPIFDGINVPQQYDQQGINLPSNIWHSLHLQFEYDILRKLHTNEYFNDGVFVSYLKNVKARLENFVNQSNASFFEGSVKFPQMLLHPQIQTMILSNFTPRMRVGLYEIPIGSLDRFLAFVHMISVELLICALKTDDCIQLHAMLSDCESHLTTLLKFISERQDVPFLEPFYSHFILKARCLVQKRICENKILIYKALNQNNDIQNDQYVELVNQTKYSCDIASQHWNEAAKLIPTAKVQVEFMNYFLPTLNISSSLVLMSYYLYVLVFLNVCVVK